MGYPFMLVTGLNNRPIAVKVRETKIPTPIICVIDYTQPEDKKDVTHIWVGEGVTKVVEPFATVIARMEAELGEKLLPTPSATNDFLTAANTKRLR